MRCVQAIAADFAICNQIAFALSLNAEKLALKCRALSHQVAARSQYAVVYASNMQPWRTPAERVTHWHFDQLLNLPVHTLPGSQATSSCTNTLASRLDDDRTAADTDSTPDTQKSDPAIHRGDRHAYKTPATAGCTGVMYYKSLELPLGLLLSLQLLCQYRYTDNPGGLVRRDRFSAQARSCQTLRCCSCVHTFQSKDSNIVLVCCDTFCTLCSNTVDGLTKHRAGGFNT